MRVETRFLGHLPDECTAVVARSSVLLLTGYLAKPVGIC